jgi:triosephosphate isomerase
MARKIIAGNWKMNLLRQEALSLTAEIIGMLQDEVKENVDVVLFPSYVHLTSVSQLCKGVQHLFTGAQDCSMHASGAYTGEISSGMLYDYGCSHVLIGHSERRQYHHETDALLAEKTNAALNAQLKPVYCIGETLSERETEQHFERLRLQLETGIFHLDAQAFSRCVLAYEPVWAIGTGKTASPAQAQEVHAFIRLEVAKRYGKAVAENTSILYGGSCNEHNAAELFAQADVDGGLIGGASLKSRSFINIVKALH